MATEVRPSAAVELTLLSKERPLAAEMKAWVEENLTRLPPDQRALVMGVVHQNLISFEPATVLATLVENSAAGITAPMVAARDADLAGSQAPGWGAYSRYEGRVWRQKQPNVRPLL